MSNSQLRFTGSKALELSMMTRALRQQNRSFSISAEGVVTVDDGLPMPSETDLEALRQQDARRAKYQPVSPKQMDMWLLQTGKYASLLATVDSLPEPNKTVAKIALNRSRFFHRDDPLVNQLGQLLSMTPEQIDEAWPQIARIQT